MSPYQARSIRGPAGGEGGEADTLRRWGIAPWVALLTALLVAATPVVSLAQALPLAGRPISAVEFEGLKLLSEETLLFYLGLEVGKELEERDLNRRFKELWGRDLLDDIEVDAASDGAGVKLTIRIVERPVLRSVEYVGLKRVGRSEIDDRASRERVDVQEGLPVSRGELERLKAVIEEAYRDKGFRFAHVEATMEEIDDGEINAVYTVDEGDKVRIGDIDFDGNTVFSDLRLRWSMKKTKESGLLTRTFKKDIYNPATLGEDLDKIREIYRGAGYKNVLIREPRIDVREKGDKRRLQLTVPVEEGSRWRFGEVTVEGNEKFDDASLIGLFTVEEGGWLRTGDIDKAVENVDQAYKNRGYIFARVQPELVERDNYVADVVVHIVENDQFEISRIEFEGNTMTRDKVLRRELRIAEGLPVNMAGVKNSITKINQLTYFKLDQNEPIDFEPDTETKTVELTLKGKEDNRTELQFGAGFSEFNGFFGQLSFRTTNFLGRGETLGISLESGRQQSSVDLSYFIPWFLDRPQNLGFQIFDQDLNFRLGTGEQFERKSTGAVVSYGRNLRLFQTFTVSYTLSRFEDEVSALDQDGNLNTLTRLNIDNSSIRPVWQFNSIDNRFEPTRGQRLRLSTEYAGGFLGGNNFFVRPSLTFTFFKPVTKYPVESVFGLNIEAGLIDPFGTIENSDGERVERPLSQLERFFLGGENSIRGHSFRSIFVRDDVGNLVPDPILGSRGLGGDSFVQFNLEYHFLLGGPFRAILFVDGGNVFGDYIEFELDSDGMEISRTPISQSISLSNLRMTAGIELRLLVPVLGAPLRFIWASNLDPLPGDRFDSFTFAIGAAF